MLLFLVVSPHTLYCFIYGCVFIFKVAEKCKTLGAKKILYIPADMSSPSEPERVVRFAVQKLGKLRRENRLCII